MKKSSVIVPVASAVALVFAAAPAGAWPAPSAAATGGVCQPGGSRTPVVWSAVNLESELAGSPAHFEDVAVSPVFPTSAFTPAVLANTGSAVAHASTAVPPGFKGDVTVTFTMVWTGDDGSDRRPGSATVHVKACPQPAITTTSTTSTSTSTTSTTLAPTTTVAVAAEAVVVPEAPAAVPVVATPKVTG